MHGAVPFTPPSPSLEEDLDIAIVAYRRMDTHFGELYSHREYTSSYL
jgi:hypothetical protein